MRGFLPIRLPTFRDRGTSADSVCRGGGDDEVCADGGVRMQRAPRSSPPWRSAVSVGIYI